MHLRAGRIGKFLRAGDVIGLRVRLKDVSDVHAVIAGVLKILVDLELRIDDRAYLPLRTTYEVRQAPARLMPELLKYHVVLLANLSVAFAIAIKSASSRVGASERAMIAPGSTLSMWQ
jgi:hypothetical protein